MNFALYKNHRLFRRKKKSPEKAKEYEKKVRICIHGTTWARASCHIMYLYIVIYPHSNLHKWTIKDVKWSSSRSFLNCFSIVIITFLFLLFNFWFFLSLFSVTAEVAVVSIMYNRFKDGFRSEAWPSARERILWERASSGVVKVLFWGSIATGVFLLRNKTTW